MRIIRYIREMATWKKLLIGVLAMGAAAYGPELNAEAKHLAGKHCSWFNDCYQSNCIAFDWECNTWGTGHWHCSCNHFVCQQC